MDIDQDEFNRMFGVAPEEFQREPFFRSETVPENCHVCHEEFVWDIQSGLPPTLLAECSCGQWRLVLVD